MTIWGEHFRLLSGDETRIKAADILCACEVYRDATPEERSMNKITKTKIADGFVVLDYSKRRLAVWYDKDTRRFKVTEDLR